MSDVGAADAVSGGGGVVGRGMMEQLALATLLASFTGPEVPDWVRRRIDDGLGGVCLYGSNRLPTAEDTARVASELHAVRPSLLVALDEEGGAVTRLEAATGSSVPGNAALGAVDDPVLTRQVALALGELLAEVGIDFDLAPCADVNVDAANPVIGVRSFSADPVVASRHVAAFVQGLQTTRVAACVKHFPGHGATTVDSHLALPEVDAPLDVLAGRELTPFGAAIAAGTAAIMTAHLRAPALDPEHPATVSNRMLTGLLRGEMGFAGAIVTDALDMAGIGGRGSIPANVVRSLAAGADLCCLGPDATDDLVGACVDAVVGAVRSGALAEERLDDAAGRVAALHGVTPSAGATRGNSAHLHGRAGPGKDEVMLPTRGHHRLVLPLCRPRPSDVGSMTSGQSARPLILGDVGRTAARRALRIEGQLRGPVLGAHVIELRRAPTMAEGAVPWGLAGPLAQLDPTSSSEWLVHPEALPAALARAQAKQLVVVVRDPQCDHRRAALASALVEARPDAVVVDMGWPADGATVPPSGTRIVAYGPSQASAEAVAQLLTDPRPLRTRGWTRG